jgi:hypothetical protein
MAEMVAISNTVLTAAQWNTNVQRPLAGFANSSSVVGISTLTLSGAFQVVPGMTLSVTLANANAFVMVEINVDFSSTVAAAGGFLQAVIAIDAAVQPSFNALQDYSTTYSNRTTSATWLGKLAAGSHTIDVRALQSGAGQGFVVGINSYLTVMVFDLP